MRILVVGLGNIARRHITNLKQIDDSVELAVWRQRPDPPGWTPPEGLPVDRYLYADYDVGYWAPDAAIIANPASMHVDTTMRLAVTSAHLFVEKPLSDGMMGVESLVWACRKFKRVLYIGYDLRYYAPLIAVKEALDAGRIGRPLSIRCEVGQYLPDWRPGRDYRTSVSAQKALGGGVVLELSHEIDYARWLMGEVISVSAMMGKLSDLEVDVEDTADILLRFEGGALGNIQLDMTERSPVRRCRVVGTEGSVAVDLLTAQASVFPVPGSIGTTESYNLLHRWGSSMMQDALVAEMRHFLACCRGEAQPPVSGEDAIKTLAVCLAAKMSAEEGREVRVA